MHMYILDFYKRSKNNHSPMNSNSTQFQYKLYHNISLDTYKFVTIENLVFITGLFIYWLIFLLV